MLAIAISPGNRCCWALETESPIKKPSGVKTIYKVWPSGLGNQRERATGQNGHMCYFLEVDFSLPDCMHWVFV